MAFVVILMAVTSYAQTTGSAVALINRLRGLQDKGVMIGHQDDTVYGTTWHYESGRSDVLSICGDYPAVVGFELGRIETGADKNLDGVPFDLMRREIIKHHERGGIVTLCWHPVNFVTGKNHKDLSGNPVKSILKRGNANRAFNTALNRVAAFLASLKDSKGQTVPVIFRPWHEMSGDWFWWGTKGCSSGQYKELFIYTYRYMMAKGLKNIVWCYSLGSNRQDTRLKFNMFYPGDEYVDIIGIDIYDAVSKKNYMGDVQRELMALKNIAQEHKKLFAFTETGFKNNPESDWYTRKLLPAINESQPLYVLLWRNAWNLKNENYGPAPDKKQAPDFKRFSANPRMLFLKNINEKNAENGNSLNTNADEEKKERPVPEGVIHFNF